MGQSGFLVHAIVLVFETARTRVCNLVSLFGHPLALFRILYTYSRYGLMMMQNDDITKTTMEEQRHQDKL